MNEAIDRDNRQGSSPVGLQVLLRFSTLLVGMNLMGNGDFRNRGRRRNGGIVIPAGDCDVASDRLRARRTHPRLLVIPRSIIDAQAHTASFKDVN